MELDETMLRERFETAVSDLTPNTVTLVGGGEESGRALRRRRRWQVGASAAAAVVLVGGTFYATGDLLDHRATGPTDTNPTGLQQLVDATPRGMAAAVTRSFDLGTPFLVAGEEPNSDSESGRTLQVAVGYEIDGQKVELDTFASADVSQWKDTESCDQLSAPQSETVSCDTSPLPDGTPAFKVLMRFDDASDGGPKTTYMGVAAVRRGDQLVAVTETIQAKDGDPGYTADTLPVPLDAMVRVASDPLVGLSTTDDLNAQGEEIKDFKNSLFTTSGSSSSSSATPSVEVETGSGAASSPKPGKGN